MKAELFDITAEFALGEASELGFNLRGVKVTYDVKNNQLSCNGQKGALKPIDGKIRLRFMVDRTSVDIFGNEGRVYMPMGAILSPDNLSLEVFAKDGSARINSLQVHELRSAWPTH